MDLSIGTEGSIIAAETRWGGFDLRFMRRTQGEPWAFLRGYSGQIDSGLEFRIGRVLLILSILNEK